MAAEIDSPAVWRLESDPSFTRDVEQRGLLHSPFTLLDIGSRGGIASHWDVFGDKLRTLAVEPDPDEPGVSAVLTSEAGHASFLHRPFPATDGLYRMDELYAGTVIEPITDVVSAETVATTTLVDLFGEEVLSTVDFVKLDVEMAELDVLRGAGPLLGAALAIERLDVAGQGRPIEPSRARENPTKQPAADLLGGVPDRFRLIGQSAFDGLLDPPGTVGGKFSALGRIKAFHRFHQTDVALADQIEQREAIIFVIMRDFYDETQIGFDH